MMVFSLLSTRRLWHRGYWLMLALSVLIAAAVFAFVTSRIKPASAQVTEEQVKPYVMLLFDTSGSMTFNVCTEDWTIGGDNSTECPGSDVPCSGTDSCNTLGCGNGLRDDTRLYKVKKGITSVVNAFGEVTFGLSRFHQTPRSFSCGDTPGGWTGTCDGADILVDFSDTNQGNILAWMNNQDDYAGTAPSTGCSLCTRCAGGCDKELRGQNATPIASSLDSVRTFLNNTYLSATATNLDPKKACRPYKVILMTDGVESCGGNPQTAASNLANNANKNIPVHVVGFATAANQTALNNIASSGGTTSAVIVDNEVSLALAMANIISESVLREKCNNADDDCDTLCDENWPEVAVTGSACTNKHSATTCSAGVGKCYRTGVYVCNSAQTGTQCSVTAGTPDSSETCNNGIDDDCDGFIDENCPICIAQPEICDGKDNNCNGSIDEGYTSIACGSDVGLCEKGMTACQNGKVTCVGETPPATEICDGQDNNCDGVVDNFSEACYPPADGGCNTTTGICQGTCFIGARYCAANTWGSCLNYQGKLTEVCNGLDDDCDGTVDEGVSYTCTDYSNCTTYTSCSACPTKPLEICDGLDNDCNGKIDDSPLNAGTPCGTDIGDCVKGAYVCLNGTLTCTGGNNGTTETCDGRDNNCDGIIDNGLTGLGAVCGSNVGICKQGTTKCIGGQVVCDGETKPTTEICDGLDNNCNNAVDDNIPSVSCGTDTGECVAGHTVCTNGTVQCVGETLPTAEKCNNKDDDCDGLVDDSPTDENQLCGVDKGECKPGLTKCLAGGTLSCVGAITASPEICDGKDNDCDGTADNNITGIGDECGITQGMCKKGQLACLANPATGGFSIVCDGGVGPSNEICDGKDNDCDGSIDETYPEQGQICGTNIGECRAGTYLCNNGTLSCQGGKGSSSELCDGLDNNCNGLVDDQVPGENQPCGIDTGECQAGQTKCQGAKMICLGGVGPGDKEICNGKDDDCDGEIDEMAECPAGSQCIDGACVVPCSNGEFGCPGGTKCLNGYCIPDKCATANCKATERCTEEGECVSKCEGITCPEHEACAPTTGVCVDDTCFTKGCPSGQTCVDYACVEDPCPPGKCPEGQICSNGACFDNCINILCDSGQICKQGKCVAANACDNYPCESTFICKIVNGNATCEPDPCRLIKCPLGQTCIEGACQEDPCLVTRCPDWMTCKVLANGAADCFATSTSSLPTTEGLLASGGGGFSCQMGSSNQVSSLINMWPLMLIFLLLRRRARVLAKEEKNNE